MVADEALEQVLVAFKDMMVEVKRMQQENSHLQTELISLLKERSAPPVGPKKENNGDTPAVDTKSFNKHSSRPKPQRPVINEEVDDLEWVIFQDSWKRYKTMTGLEDEKEICLELREACSTEVNRLLYDYVGADELNKNTLKEDTLLQHIKKVAVKTVHQEVYRWNYGKLVQSDGEPITKYAARLKSQAVLCNFSVECHKCADKVSYAEDMVSQRLMTGLLNPEHQSKILSEVQDLPDLKSKIDRLVGLETTDDATSAIRTPLPSQSLPVKAQSQTCSGAIKMSQYKKNQRGQASNDRGRKRVQSTQRERPAFKRRCRGCGRTSHPGGKALIRNECPAFGKTCDNCGLENHFKKVCNRRQSRSGFAKMDDDTTGYSESSDENAADIEITDTEEETTSHSFHYAAKAEDFHRGRRQEYPG